MTSGALRNVARFIADSFLVPAAMRREAPALVPTDADAERRYREFRRLYSRAIESGRVGERSTAGQTREQLHRPLLTLLGFEPAELRAREVELDPGTATLQSFGGDAVFVDMLPYALRADDRLKAGGFKGSPHRRMVRALAASGARFGLVLGGSAWRLLMLDTANEPRYLEFDLDVIADGSDIDAFIIMLALVSPASLLGSEPAFVDLQAKSDARGVEVSDKLGPAARRALERLLDGIRADESNAAWALTAFVEGPELQRIHREGIYVLYRLLFVLFGEAAVPPALPIDKPLYRNNYSLERLRSAVTGDPREFAENSYGLWAAVKALFRLIDRGAHTKEFTVPSYNGGLFAPDRTPLLDRASLSDRAFALVLRELTTVEMGKGKQRALDQVSFRELGVGQLGAVFEGLLDYEPHIASGDLYETKVGNGKQKVVSFLPASALGKIPQGDAKKSFGEFYLQAWGGQRKSTGAYYTPKVIADYLVREALSPQVEGKSPDEILALTVCDPAMGSGGFLVSATEFLGDAYYRAQVAASECDPDDERADLDRLAAKRIVAEYCVYGVDVNPMAVELAKVSLWLTTLAYDRPLSFFDHHLRCGNSLLSAPLRNNSGALTAGALESVASAALKDVDKEATPEERTRLKAVRAKNSAELKALERGGGLGLFSIDLTQSLHDYALRRAELSADDPLEPATSAAERNRAKERLLRQLTGDSMSPFARIKEICDLWMAPWFWPYDARVDPPSTDTLRTLQRAIWDGINAPTALAMTREIAREVAFDFRFFHWELEFPEVFEGGGFHAVVGNPPWETLSPKTQEFFSNVNPVFRTYAKQKAVLEMTRLRREPEINVNYRRYSRRVYNLATFLKTSGTYTWYAEGNLGKGDFDLFRSFVERDYRSLRGGGRLAQVLKDSFYLNANCTEVRRRLFTDGRIVRLIVNENRKGVFAIDSRIKIAMLTAEKGTKSDWIGTAFFVGKNPDLSERALSVAELEKVLARPDEVTMFVETSLIEALSPETVAFFEIHSRADIQVFEHLRAIGITFGSSWGRIYARELDTTVKSDLFVERKTLEQSGASFDGIRWQHPEDGAYWPLVQGRNIYQFEFPVGDFRYWVRERDSATLPKMGGKPINFYPRIAWRDVASTTNERTLIASVVPPQTFCSDKALTIRGGVLDVATAEQTVALMNSFIFDWQVRSRGATSQKYSVINSVMVPGVLESLQVLATSRPSQEANVFAAYHLSFELAEHVMAGFPLLDRLQTALEGEPRSTISRDLVLATYAERLRHPKASYYRDRADRATKLGAVPFIPASRDEGQADESNER